MPSRGDEVNDILLNEALERANKALDELFHAHYSGEEAKSFSERPAGGLEALQRELEALTCIVPFAAPMHDGEMLSDPCLAYTQGATMPLLTKTQVFRVMEALAPHIAAERRLRDLSDELIAISGDDETARCSRDLGRRLAAILRVRP
jgi:hypothetical protein